MDDYAAGAVNWLSKGRTSALVAPALRVATAPGARRQAERARELAEAARQLDADRLRRIAEILRDDREFRAGLMMAGGRLQRAMASSERRGRGRRALSLLALLAIVGGAVLAWRRLRPRTDASAPVNAEPAEAGAGQAPYPVSSPTG